MKIVGAQARGRKGNEKIECDYRTNFHINFSFFASIWFRTFVNVAVPTIWERKTAKTFCVILSKSLNKTLRWPLSITFRLNCNQLIVSLESLSTETPCHSWSLWRVCRCCCCKFDIRYRVCYWRQNDMTNDRQNTMPNQIEFNKSLISDVVAVQFEFVFCSVINLIFSGANASTHRTHHTQYSGTRHSHIYSARKKRTIESIWCWLVLKRIYDIFKYIVLYRLYNVGTVNSVQQLSTQSVDVWLIQTSEWKQKGKKY